MSNTQESQPISINISTKENEKKQDDYSKFKEYIIVNNISLQNEVKEAIKNLHRSLREYLEPYHEKCNCLSYPYIHILSLRSSYALPIQLGYICTFYFSQ